MPIQVVWLRNLGPVITLYCPERRGRSVQTRSRAGLQKGTRRRYTSVQSGV